MKTNSRERAIAMTVTFFFILATWVAMYFFNVKSNVETALTAAQLKNEKMLSEKLVLAKEIDKLKNEVRSFRGKNDGLDKKLASMERLLSQKEAQLNQVTINSNASLADYQSQMAAVQLIRDQLHEEMARQTQQLSVLQSENASLKDAMAVMEVNKEELITKNHVLSQIISENYGVEAHKRKQKLTVSARRAKEIQLGFDVPVEMTEKLSFTITSPDGKQTASNSSKTITYAVNDRFEFGDTTATASLIDLGLGSNISNRKRVVLSYKPESKLTSGIYHINVYSDDTFIGSSQIRLK